MRELVVQLRDRREQLKHFRTFCSVLFASICVLALVAGPAQAQQKKPNILVIMGDDVG